MKKFLLLLVVAMPLWAQQPGKAFTADDYARAEKFLPQNLGRLVVGGAVMPHWLPDGRFWYRNQTAKGSEYVVIDPGKRTRKQYTPTASDTAGEARGGGRGFFRGRFSEAVKSPDGKQEAFVRDWNLWVRDVASGKEKQLTTDGETNFGYATDNAGWVHSNRAILLWSPDSRKISTQQQDERKVGDMYLVDTKAGHPVLSRGNTRCRETVLWR